MTVMGDQMMRIKLVILGLIISLWVLLAGCSSQLTRVSKDVPNERNLGFEILDMRNCASEDDMNTTLASEAPVVYRVSVAKYATLNATGEEVEIPGDQHAILEDEVISAFEQEYEEAVANAEQVELAIPAHMIYMYDIRWKEQTYSSTLSFSIEDQNCTADYTYALETPELTGHKVMACTA